MKQYLTDGNVEINHVLYNSDIQNGGSHNILNNLNKNLTGGSRNEYLINKLERKQERLVKNANLIKNAIFENISSYKHDSNDIKNLIDRYTYDKAVSDKLELSIIENLINLVQ